MVVGELYNRGGDSLDFSLFFKFFVSFKSFILVMWGPTVSGTQTTLEEAKPNILSHKYGLCERGPGPTSYLRVKEYPRTINKGRNKVLLRGEMKNACGDLTVSEDYSHLGNSIRGVW